MKRQLRGGKDELRLALAVAALVVLAGFPRVTRGAERLVLGEEFTGLG